VHFYNNEYDQALAIFQNDLNAHPNEADDYNDLAQAILYREMYRNGSLESQLVTGTNSFLRRPKMAVSPQDKARFLDATNRALSLSEARLKQNDEDINALFSQAVAHGLRANFAFLVEKAWMQALHEAMAARKADDEILRLAPNVVDAHLLHGVSEYVVGCMPAYLRMLGAINGFHANKEDGIEQIQLVVKSGTRNRFDAAILLAAIYRREHRPNDAIPLLNMLAATFPRNYLFRFEQVQMYSDLGNKQAALHVLAQIETALREGKPGFAKVPLERVQYARGNLLFWYGDLDQSLRDLKDATRRPDELDLGTAAMAWLRLGQVYDLLDRPEQARPAYETAISTAPHSEIAAEAGAYLKKPYHRKTK
jgi:tetratricopeptide (TPR) repeat protein